MQTIQKLIEEGLDRVEGEHIFIQHKDRTVSAQELKRDIGAIASGLKNRGICSKTPIAVYVSDRIHMIEGMLGILKAACIFVPTETEFPNEVLGEMMQISKAQYMLVDREFADSRFALESSAYQIIVLEELLEEFREETKNEERKTEYCPDDPIYIYFTSGTTGRPKAILGRNKGLAHFIEWEARKVNCENVNVSQITSPCHDPFLRDVFLALRLKGKICIPEDRRAILDGSRLLQWIGESEINVLHCTPSVANHMLNAVTLITDFPALKFVFLAGEKVRPQLVAKWYEKIRSEVRLVNLYGPTETTLAKISYDILPEDSVREDIPIGKAMDDTEVYLLDENMRVCCTGEEGEIYIATPYRSLGYIDNEEMNQKHFLSLPDITETVLYKTGDIGKVNTDGNIEFIGRKDHQVKIRGNRVELSYVEARILEMEKVRECVLVFNDDTLGKEYIAAYLTVNQECKKAEILEWLKDKVPVYMIPSYIIFLKELPLTCNMKVDRKRLPMPFEVHEEEQQQAELSGTERKLIDECEDILGNSHISIEDSFFAYGGTSLNVMTLVSRIYEVFGVEISLGEILGSSSLKEIANLIEANSVQENPESGTQELKYTYSEYQERKKKGIYGDLKAGHEKYAIEGIKPFNKFFYRSCIYNAIFSVIEYYGGDILQVLSNDVILYKSLDQVNMVEKVTYIGEQSIENILETMGIRMKRIDKKDGLIESIIASIDRGNPVVVGVDCFYEPIRPEFYLKENWPHNILIYGYDHLKQEFCVMEHTGINKLDYHEQKLGYLETEYAYQNNRMKYSEAEEGRYYLEFCKMDECRIKDLKACYERYKSVFLQQEDALCSNVQILVKFIDDIQEAGQSAESLLKEGAGIAGIIDAIVEAKTAQAYLLEQLMKYNKRLSESIELQNLIIKKWKLIRNVIYKYIYTQEYNSEAFAGAMNNLRGIEHIEEDNIRILKRVLLAGDEN